MAENNLRNTHNLFKQLSVAFHPKGEKWFAFQIAFCQIIVKHLQKNKQKGRVRFALLCARVK